MNVVGKILTVLIFMMSVVFASFAIAVFAGHRNYKQVLMSTEEKIDSPLGLKAKLEQAKARLDSCEEKLTALKSAIDDEKELKRQQLAKLEQERVRWKAKVEATQAELDKVLKKMREDAMACKTAHEELDRKDKQIDDLLAAIEKTRTQRADKVKEALLVTEAMHETVAERMTLQERGRALEHDAAKAAPRY